MIQNIGRRWVCVLSVGLFAAALHFAAAPLSAQTDAPYVRGEVLVGFWPSLGQADIKLLVKSLGYSIKNDSISPGAAASTATILVEKGGERSAVGRFGRYPDKVKFAHLNWIVQPQ